MVTPRLRPVLVGLLWALLPSGALAQAQAPEPKKAPAASDAPAATPPEAPPATAPATEPTSEPASAATPPPAPAADGPASACFPACRDGFLCHEGTCISACNPACAEDEQCMDGRLCVPRAHLFPPGPGPSYMPWPSLPPSDADVPPPPGSWQPRFPVTRKPRRPRDYPRFQGYIGLQLGLGGGGKIVPADDDRFDPRGIERGYDLDASGGGEAVLEFRVGRYFGVGPGLRAFRVRADNGIGMMNSFDLMVVPTIHIPLGSVELFMPIPLGLTFGNVPDNLPGEGSAGVTVGFNPGLVTWLNDRLGIYGQLGVQSHFRGYEEYGANFVVRFHRPTLTLGLSLRD